MGKWDIKMLWDNGEEPWKSPRVTNKMMPWISPSMPWVAKLTNTLGWKKTKKFNGALKRIVEQLIRIHAPKAQDAKAKKSELKFGTQVADNVTHAYLMERMKGIPYGQMPLPRSYRS